ncbi:7-alpha-hydroxysteroid dehydrogenase [Helicobacter winghamensis]|uniref:7-alpha-hydroxysteroid dehydrogenase n=2 Tax=Helicobacter winghamensis TaxID=157268 RepID=A0A2N3PHG1_9HELI|nr:7-alpha-hydroxysteroid dehydrogenase [Helicobacter winghamensis]PKT75577.1 7-alpha-hydroxysteroid dehydrogenase [Helicobacter winghamensis]PKT79487.1 7-alpha-hydroxysteroid dehydrogenase [Helicobacter winghamensis]PKT79790.1 7-alpha-hydroxysteroid dehydrogenase [Helicobacter winghamensis]PKT79873.1 7-alpha-hydroxysteroid dehydrogenase [Helicobacter winghamensis]
MMENFKGKTLVISGATRGIGKAILYRFAQNGVNIAFTYNKNEEEAQNIIKDVESKYGIKAKAYPLNVLEPETYKDLFVKIDEDFERVDFFISNAIIYGKSVVGGFAPFMRLKPKGLNNIYTATVLAFVVGAQEAAKRMQKIGGGSIISLSSTGNLVYMPNYAGHGNSKNAVETMVKYAAMELGEFNIRVNAVSGGPIDTDALKAFPDYAEIKAAVESQSPLNRMGQPSDIAGACLFLCDSDSSSWLTGQTIVIDGGTSFK